MTDVHVTRRRPAAHPKRRLNVAKLHTTTGRADLRYSEQRAFASSSNIAENSINNDWESFRSTAYTAAAESLGYPRRVNADWLLGNNRAAFQERLSNPRSQTAIQHHTQTKSKLQRELRQVEDSWWNAKADEVQALSDRGDSSGVFLSLKSNYGPRRPSSSPVLAAVGNTLLTSKPDILSRWKDYYATLLNRPTEINDQILESIQQCPIRDELEKFLTKREIEQAIASTANNKAARLDGIPAEVHKHGGDTLVANLVDRCRCYWESGDLP